MAGRDPDEITREIEQTRAELADTIDRIAQQVSPKSLIARGKEVALAASQRREVQAAAGAVVVLAIVIWRRRRRS